MTCRPEKQSDSIRAYSNNDDGALSGCQFNRRAYTWPWECRPVVMSPQDTIEHTHLRDQEELRRTCVYRERRKMEKKGANVRRKSEKRKPPRARREKILNYRKWPRRPCRNSMNCVTYRNVIRTSPGGAYAYMRTHDGEIEVPTLVPSHRRVKHG